MFVRTGSEVRDDIPLVPDPLEHWQVVIFLVAGGLEQLAPKPLQRNRDRERPGVDERIGDGRFVADRVRIDGRKALEYVLGIAEHVAHFAAPRLAVEVRRFDDERVAVPVAD